MDERHTTVDGGARAGERGVSVAADDDGVGTLEFDQVFTPRLRESSQFRDAFVDASTALAERGSIAAMERL